MSSFHSKSKIGQINFDETQLRMPQGTLFYEKNQNRSKLSHNTPTQPQKNIHWDQNYSTPLFTWRVKHFYDHKY